MFRRLFWLLAIVGVYVWVMSTDEDKTLYDKAKTFVYSCIKTAKQNEIDVHVHSPDCFHKDKKIKRKWR